MIAKIGRSANLYGALSYNQRKVEKEKGTVLYTNKMIEPADGRYTMRQLLRSFESYLIANRNTEKPVLHISLNPDPKDQVSDEQFIGIASDYLGQMGYGEQPFIVYKHSDIERSHIHIVTLCIDKNGKKISDRYDKVRSMKVCRDLEYKYRLVPATAKEYQHNKKIFQPVDHQAGDIKSQIASVVRHLPGLYQYRTLGEYNALLSLFNITTEIVEVKRQDEIKKGLLYIPLNEKGERAGHPLKASLFGKSAGFSSLEKHCIASKKSLKDNLIRKTLQSAITRVLRSTTDEEVFKKKLSQQGIDVFVRRNYADRIYGITFIDHNSKSVWNGSGLAKELSANSFNEYWNKNVKEGKIESADRKKSASLAPIEDRSHHKAHDWSDFVFRDQNKDGLFEAFGSLLPEAKGEDYEEYEFAKNMKKKRKGKRGLH